jgi:NifB/MoaA-like Fe-S oxidoreductase
MIFAADEYYLMADRPFPPAEHYEGFAQHENGIGMARTFAAEVDAALAGHAVTGTGPRAGFFASVDGAPAEGYRAPRTRRTQLGVRDARDGAPIVLLTGEYGARVLAPHLASLGDLAGVEVRLHAVRNRFFGGNIAVTGLMTGADVGAVLAGVPAGARVLLPDVALSQDRFLDGARLADLPRAVEVVGTDGASLVAALRTAAAAA